MSAESPAAPESPRPAQRPGRPRWLVPVIITAVVVVIVIPLGIAVAVAVSALLVAGSGAPAGSPPACRQVEAREEGTTHYRESEGCLPVGFPKDIPLAGGSVVYGIVDVDGVTAHYEAQVLATDAARATAAVDASFLGAGYRFESDHAAALETTGLVYANDHYAVLVTYQDSGAYGPVLTYSVDSFPASR